MSHLSSVFNKVPVKVQKRSGFDLSHENLFSAKIGTLIPASVEEVMPGDVISIGGAMSVELPPLATNFKGRVDAKLEAFFVPNRILWAGWQDFITQDVNTLNAGQTGITGGSGVTVPSYNVPTYTPEITIPASRASAGTLTDYLGVRGASAGANLTLNALPFCAYKKIWEDWYRDSNVQQPFFTNGIGWNSSQQFTGATPVAMLPMLRNSGNMSNLSNDYYQPGSLKGYNGELLIELNQRNFMKDYFTTMTYEPQAGAGANLVFNVDTANTTAGFSIAQLRAANSLQRWLERNNVAGTRYYDQILAHYGVLPPDASFQRPVLLGSMTTPVIVNTVMQTNAPAATGGTADNPYKTVGAQYGRGTSFGKDRLVDKFEVKEHGYIMIMFSLVPHAYYSTGSRKYIYRSKSSDYAFPEFANIGDEEVKAKQLAGNFSSVAAGDRVVGYVQRYADYKYHDDEIHGLLQDGQSLNKFVLSRGFTTGVTLGSSLLEIPTNFMDNVMVTDSSVSGFNAIVDAYFDSKILRALPEYSLPSLCNDEGQDGKKVYVPKGGVRL